MSKTEKENILQEAKKLVTGSRQKDYGNSLHNHENIAKLWSAYLGHTIRPQDVALMMALLKIARTKTGTVNRDDYVDGAAYMAIAGEIEKSTGNHISFESEGERKGRETAKYIKSLNKCPHN